MLNFVILNMENLTLILNIENLTWWDEDKNATLLLHIDWEFFSWNVPTSQDLLYVVTFDVVSKYLLSPYVHFMNSFEVFFVVEYLQHCILTRLWCLIIWSHYLLPVIPKPFLVCYFLVTIDLNHRLQFLILWLPSIGITDCSFCIFVSFIVQ